MTNKSDSNCLMLGIFSHLSRQRDSLSFLREDGRTCCCLNLKAWAASMVFNAEKFEQHSDDGLGATARALFVFTVLAIKTQFDAPKKIASLPVTQQSARSKWTLVIRGPARFNRFPQGFWRS